MASSNAPQSAPLNSPAPVADLNIQDNLPPPAPVPEPPGQTAPVPVSSLGELGAQVSSWAQTEAQTIAAQGLTGIQVSPDTVARTQDLLQKLATNGIQALGADAATKAVLAQSRDLYLSALKDLGVVGTKSIEDVVGQSARKFFVDAADFVLQGLTKAGL